MHRFWLAVAVLLALGVSVPAHAEPPPRLSIEGHALTLAFHDEFDRLNLDVTRKGTGWVPLFHTFNVRWLKGNQELQLYVDHAFLEKAGLPTTLDPFRLKDGILTIRAHRLTTLEAAAAQAPQAAFTSGLLSSERMFSQTYGYFALRARLPTTAGTWPAFWLLPTSGRWPPEIDIMEVLGQEPDRVYQNALTAEKKSDLTSTRVDPGVDHWHEYAALWTPEEIVWFIDGRATKRMANVSNEPMYILINLAVGGRWPGRPPDTAAFPVDMAIDYVRAYALGERQP